MVMNDITPLPEAGEFYSSNGRYCVHLSSDLLLRGSRLKLTVFPRSPIFHIFWACSSWKQPTLHCLSVQPSFSSYCQRIQGPQKLYFLGVKWSTQSGFAQARARSWSDTIAEGKWLLWMSICCFVKNVVKNINKSDITSCCDVKQLS